MMSQIGMMTHHRLPATKRFHPPVDITQCSVQSPHFCEFGVDKTWNQDHHFIDIFLSLSALSSLYSAAGLAAKWPKATRV
jgi:hypothetical protein